MKANIPMSGMKEFAQTVAKILNTDRWVLLTCTGDMGEGKSCFTSKLSKFVATETKTPFTYKDNMTFSRKELKLWIDGDKDGKNQKAEYSVILADELISMFFKRNWYDAEQIDGIELLNKCRDRHLCVIGNVPHFWDLDSAIYPIVTFWVHIPERGRAWVFQKDPNPFENDKWHKKDNTKIFRKSRNPYRCINFVCEIHFGDWTPEEKKTYYNVRNTKRKGTEGQREQREKYRNVKRQRDSLIVAVNNITRMIEEFLKNHDNVAEAEFLETLKLNNKDLAEITGLSRNLIEQVIAGTR